MARKRSPKRRRRIECWWLNPPTEPRVLLHIVTDGHRVERRVGPRGLLDLAEAAAVLRVPARPIRRAIDRGDLRARWTHDEPFVTLRDAVTWWERKEDRFDREAADRALREMEAAGERPIPWGVARKQLSSVGAPYAVEIVRPAQKSLLALHPAYRALIRRQIDDLAIDRVRRT